MEVEGMEGLYEAVGLSIWLVRGRTARLSVLQKGWAQAAIAHAVLGR